MVVQLVVPPSQSIALNHGCGGKGKEHRTFTATPSCPQPEMTCMGLASHVVPTQMQGGMGSFPMCPERGGRTVMWRVQQGCVLSVRNDPWAREH